MPTTFTTTTLSGLYNDDYQDSDNYHQILFNSGRALQARELTQLQTMIYQEMGRFGGNIFKEGSAVSFGGVGINSFYDYVQIATIVNGVFSDIPVGTIFTNDNGVKAKVISVLNSTVSNPNTLYVSYIDGGANVASGESPSFSPSDNITAPGFGLTVWDTGQNGATSPVGRGTRVDVAGGDFFVLGRFVRATPQNLILSKFSQTANTTIGYKVIQEVVSVNDTTDLYDNSGGIINNASPGADRYRIRLELVEKTSITSDDTFVFVAKIQNSKIVEKVDVLDDYNKINDVLALRTNEESGDYIVKPFTIAFDSADDASNLSLTVSSGIAYVNGYRVENPSPIELIVPKSQSTEVVNSDVVPVIYGNYVLLDTATDLPDLTYGSLEIASDLGGSSKIGECRIRGIEPSGSGYKLYLFDVVMDAGQDFAAARSIDNGKYVITNSTGSAASLLGTTDNDLLFPTSRPRLSSLDNVIITTQRTAIKTASGTTLTLDTLTGDSYTDTSQWLIYNITDNTAVTVPTVDITNPQQATISGLIDTKQYRISYYIKTSQTATGSAFTLKSKALTTSVGSYYADVVTGEVDLGVPDVYEIDEIRIVAAGGGADNTTGADCSERFILDDGQRDNYYANSKLLLKGGESDPLRVYVAFKYYAHSTGDFFAASSYASYADIPEHTLQDGTIVSLRNYLDFRPDKDAAGAFTKISYLPRNGTSINADISYYLPRADKLLVTQEGDIQILMGQQSRDPQLKKTPDNALELYQILMNANTIDQNDVQVKPIEHKLYTMSDIGKLDNKIDELREYTELNLAELRAFHTPGLDSDGVERPDAGLIVDNGDDQSGAATDDGDYSAALDPENKLIRPKADEDNIRLICETDYGTSNIVKRGDNVYLQFDSDEWKFQDLASRSIKINPFGMVDNVGVIKMSPSTDEWKDCKSEAIKAIQGTSRLDSKQAFLWNNWQWNWKGRNDDDLWVSAGDKSRLANGIRSRASQVFNDFYTSSRSSKKAAGFVRRVVASDTLRMRIGHRTIDLALIPWIRSRKIYFHAKGLTPNTKFTPFFDGKIVTDWCREETTFVPFSDRTDDIGNQGAQYSAHPDGSTELQSDDNGEIIGSFYIPNRKPLYYISKKLRKSKIKTEYLRFRSGVREFKLLDINVNDWAKAKSKAFGYYSVVGALNNKSNNILTTRGYKTVSPLGLGFAGHPSTYSPIELQSALNGVSLSGGYTGIFEAQLAGKYGPGTSFLNNTQLQTLSNNGELSQVLSDYISVNNKQYPSGSTSIVPTPQNPLAQTFYVDNQFGLVLTTVSLYFKTKSTQGLPVSIHLRPVVNGKPSSTDIVPDSHVFLNPSDVKTPEVNEVVTLNTIQEDFETLFTFEEPIFLQPWTNYAIVVSSVSDEYEIYSAKTKESVLGSAGRLVTTQEGNGTLFLPQNGVVWLESMNQDLMMKLTRAKFDLSGGTLMLKNAPLSALLLEKNPIRLYSGSDLVYVNAPCHGLSVGDVTTLSGCTTVDNVSSATLNTAHTVEAVDLEGYRIQITGINPTKDISGGGDEVLSRRNAIFDVANPNIESIIPNFSSVDYSAKFLTGNHISDTTTVRFRPNNQAGSMIDAKFEKITPDQNIEFDQPRAIFNSAKIDGTSGLGSTTPGSNASVYVKVDLKTSNDYISPIIDLQRTSLTLIGECFDDGNTSLNPVSETAASGGTAGSKHITTPVTLEVPAVSIDVKAEVTTPPGSNVDLYYRTATADQNISEVSWVYQPPENSIANSTSSVEAHWLPGGKNGTLPPFQQAQTKFVMTGIDRAPRLTMESKQGIVTRFFAV